MAWWPDAWKYPAYDLTGRFPYNSTMLTNYSINIITIFTTLQAGKYRIQFAITGFTLA